MLREKLTSSTFFYIIIAIELVILLSLLALPILSQDSKEQSAFHLDAIDQIAKSVEGIKLADKFFPAETRSEQQLTIQKAVISAPTGLPVKFLIPKLGIKANVEYVGLDSAGRMDIPKEYKNVAWYKLGYKVGDNGSAVITGHYDTPTGAPAVFWSIAKLNKGDAISVYDTSGAEHRFIVKEKQVYQYDKLPLEKIFGTPGVPSLNLITCSGVWNRNTKNYSTRTVIYASKI